VLDDLSKFSASAVRKFQTDRASINPELLRHYNQLGVAFDNAEVQKTLYKFRIPSSLRATVYGGYTGQFAECLRSVGMHVVFTDPIQEWVDAAHKKGFESHRLSVQEIPRDMIERTDLFASFECYPDLLGADSGYYQIMRLLTAAYGIPIRRITRHGRIHEGSGPR